MKKNAKKLVLNRQTVRVLSEQNLDNAGGGAAVSAACPCTTAITCCHCQPSVQLC